jgi:hypothetical protein
MQIHGQSADGLRSWFVEFKAAESDLETAKVFG